MWYRLTGTGRAIVADLCTASYDTKLFVYCSTTSQCTAPSALACITGNDDSSQCADTSHSRVRFCSAPGQTYFVLVSGFSGATGTFVLNVNDDGPCTTAVPCVPQGACCAAIGTCTRTSQAACTGTWTAGALCQPSPCVGACCNAVTGTCTSTLPTSCTGTFLGLGIACSPNPCSGACCDATGICSITGPSGCSSGFYWGVLSTCSPLPCDLPGAQANSRCALATPFGGTDFIATGSTLQAGTDPSPAICVPSTGDVWFAFTPSISQAYDLSLCDSAVEFDAVLSVHSACPTVSRSNAIPGACADDGCDTGAALPALSDLRLVAGTTVLIRVAGYGQPFQHTGDFTLAVTQILGSCCNPATGSCSVTNEPGCAAPAVWSARSGCDPAGCLGLTGACCDPATGACILLTTVNCHAPMTFLGSRSVCEPVNLCPAPTGACCTPSGLCITATRAACTGRFAGANLACSPTACPSGPSNDLCSAASPALVGSNLGTLTNAQSDGSSACSPSGGADVYFSFTAPASGGYELSLCSTDNAFDTVLSVHSACPATAATQLDSSACNDDGCGAIGSLSRIPLVLLTSGQTCQIRVGTYDATITGGDFILSITQVPVGACCIAGEACTLNTADRCQGHYQGHNTACDAGACPASGACCDAVSGACTITSLADCASGTYQGDGSACAPSPCPASGACCNSDLACCTITVNAACTGTWTQDAACFPEPCSAPSNDLPSGAIALTLGSAVTGANCSATDAADGPSAPCQPDAGKGVWFSFTAPFAGPFTFSTCGTPQDTVLTLLSTDLATVIACDDDSCDGGPGSPFASLISALDLAENQTILVRVSSFGAQPQGGTFSLIVTSDVPVGACCRGAICTLAPVTRCGGSGSRSGGPAPSAPPAPAHPAPAAPPTSTRTASSRCPTSSPISPASSPPAPPATSRATTSSTLKTSSPS